MFYRSSGDYFPKRMFQVANPRFRQAAEVLKGIHQTADEGWRITAFDKGHKAHARIAQHRRNYV